MKRKQKPFAMPFRDAQGNIGITLPSDMTIEDMVRLGLEPKMVPKDEPQPPGAYRYNYEKDMPNDLKRP
jgi:hypothetical protein